jgi:hypothetical protein
MLRALLLLLATLGQRGITKYYEPGAFAQVAANRGMTLAWDQVDGFASTQHCELVDVRRPWVVLARIQGGPVERFQIVDCSRPGRDVARHRAEGLVLEVDFATALRALVHGRPALRRDGHAPVQIVGYRRLPVWQPAR